MEMCISSSKLLEEMCKSPLKLLEEMCKIWHRKTIDESYAKKNYT